MHEFAANLLELDIARRQSDCPVGAGFGEPRSIAAARARVLRDADICEHSHHRKVLGGGGVRCMLAEVHLPKHGELMA